MSNHLHRKIALIIVSFILAPTCFAQYQLHNPGFESWEGASVSASPSNWSSFPQADGSWAWAASTAQHYHRNGGRPGTSGSAYLTIYSRSVLGVVANGNMTTGQIHAGSTSASSSSNYNYTHRGSAYCHTFSGTPDSMYVWVSYYASSASSQGSVRAYLHGDSDFKDPNDCATASLYRGKAVAEFARTTTSATSPTWVQQRVPFTYDGTSSVNYILMSMTTNTTAGGGSANDSLSVDDIEFIYSAWLDNIEVNGVGIANFQRDVFHYFDTVENLSELNAATLSFTKQASDATVVIDTLWPNSLTRQFVLHVLAEDSVTSRTYTVTLTARTDLTAITTVPVPEVSFRLYPNPANDRVCVVLYGKGQDRHISLFDATGRKVLQQHVDADGGQMDISHLSAGLYTAVMHIKGRVVAEQRLSIVR